MAPRIISPTVRVELLPVFETGSLIMTCVATGKPDLTSSSFRWTTNGTGLTDNPDYIQTFSTGASGDYSFGLTHSWNSSLYMNASATATCESVTDYDGDYQCDVTALGSVAASSIDTVEILCRYSSISYNYISFFKLVDVQHFIKNTIYDDRLAGLY